MKLVLFLGLVGLGLAADLCKDAAAAKNAIIGKFPKKMESFISLDKGVTDPSAAKAFKDVTDSFDFFRGVNARCDLIDECVLGKEKSAELKKLAETTDDADAYLAKREAYINAASFPAMFGTKQSHIASGITCLNVASLVDSLERGIANFKASQSTGAFDGPAIAKFLAKIEPEATIPTTKPEQFKLFTSSFTRYLNEFKEDYDAYKFHATCSFVASALSTSSSFETLKKLRETGTAKQFEAQFMSNCEKAKPAQGCDIVPLCASVLYWRP